MRAITLAWRAKVTSRFHGTIAHRDDAGGEAGLDPVMCRDHECSSLARGTQHHVVHRLTGSGVQTGGRFVEKEEFGIADDRAATATFWRILAENVLTRSSATSSSATRSSASLRGRG